MARRTPAAPPAPRFVRHAKRPAWGVGHVTDVYVGLVRVRFEDGTLREFRDDVLEPVAEADVPPGVRALSVPQENPPAVASPPKRASRKRTP